MGSLAGKTVFVTGASRGIGEAIAVRAGRDGANVVLAAKTAEPHARLPGTIHTAAAAVEAAGGQALPIALDLRDSESVEAAVRQAAEHFGGIDILVNNASALFLAGTVETPMKRFDLVHEVNVRGTFVASRACIPWLQRSAHAHILNIAPPLTSDPRWFAPHLAYSLAKYGMSLCALGMATELAEDGIGVNCLWPRTTIATAAVRNLLGGDAAITRSRRPEIMADAAQAILCRDPRSTTGRFFIDDDVLREEGVTDFDCYAVEPGADLLPDFFV